MLRKNGECIVLLVTSVGKRNWLNLWNYIYNENRTKYPNLSADGNMKISNKKKMLNNPVTDPHIYEVF